VVHGKGRKKSKRNPSDSRLERGRGMRVGRGTQIETETPPSRVWSEGGDREVVGGKRRNPSDSRLERGRGMRGGRVWWAPK
jgi:hypothetical protein